MRCANIWNSKGFVINCPLDNMPIQFKIVKDDIFIYTETPDDAILREDMYQATYEQYAIDCGWYEPDEGGEFVTYLIKDNDWDAPLIKIVVKEFEDAKWSIKACKEYLENHFTT
jgi:hypothetical protein